MSGRTIPFGEQAEEAAMKWLNWLRPARRTDVPAPPARTDATSTSPPVTGPARPEPTPSPAGEPAKAGLAAGPAPEVRPDAAPDPAEAALLGTLRHSLRVAGEQLDRASPTSPVSPPPRELLRGIVDLAPRVLPPPPPAAQVALDCADD